MMSARLLESKMESWIATNSPKETPERIFLLHASHHHPDEFSNTRMQRGGGYFSDGLYGSLFDDSGMTTQCQIYDSRESHYVLEVHPTNTAILDGWDDDCHGCGGSLMRKKLMRKFGSPWASGTHSEFSDFVKRFNLDSVIYKSHQDFPDNEHGSQVCIKDVGIIANWWQVNLADIANAYRTMTGFDPYGDHY